VAAAELPRRYGVNPTARALGLEYGGLRKRVENQGQSRAKRKKAEGPSFMEFVAPGAKAVTNCTVEVESAQGGKLKLELKGVATSELSQSDSGIRKPLSDAADRTADAHPGRA